MTGKAWALGVFVLTASACKPEAPSSASAAQTVGATTPPKTSGGAPAPSGPGRGGATITLAASDITVVQPGTLEDVSAISGDLHPIETVVVRSRIEGDVDAVLVREGDQVRAGQVLARFEPSEQESALRSAEADKASALSDLANAQWNAEQSAQLFKAGAISERDHKAAQQAVTSAQARLAAAESRVKSTSSVVRDTRVVSPTAGIIQRRDVEAGEHVSRGATLFSVVRNDVLELAAAMPARDASLIRIGQPVRFIADGRAFTGKVARLSPTIDPVTRAMTVYVQIPNPSGALRGGTFATGQVITRTIDSVLSLPRTAIHYRQNSDAKYVYRIVGKTIEVASVKTGVIDEAKGVVEVVEGLKAGDRVVSGNVGSLGRGMQVSIVGEEPDGRGGRAGGRGTTGTPR